MDMISLPKGEGGNRMSTNGKQKGPLKGIKLWHRWGGKKSPMEIQPAPGLTTTSTDPLFMGALCLIEIVE